jgi:hypothetical protein
MSKILVRVGGVAAVVAALLIIAQQLWTELVTDPGPQEYLTDSIMYSSQLLLMVFGVIGIALAQQRRAGVFAQIAALVAVLGCVLWFGASLVEVTLLPSLMAAGSPLVDNPPTGLVIVGLASFVTYLVGLLLLSVSIIVTKVLPWQAAAVLGGGIVLALPLSSVVPGILAVYAIGFGWLGVACVRAAIMADAKERDSAHRVGTPTAASIDPSGE